MEVVFIWFLLMLLGLLGLILKGHLRDYDLVWGFLSAANPTFWFKGKMCKIHQKLVLDVLGRGGLYGPKKSASVLKLQVAKCRIRPRTQRKGM